MHLLGLGVSQSVDLCAVSSTVFIARSRPGLRSETLSQKGREREQTWGMEVQMGTWTTRDGTGQFTLGHGVWTLPGD